MTTDFEKQFFYTFSIKPIRYNSSLEDWEFPPITDRILLELICICSQFEQLMTCCYMTVAEDVEQLKIDILEDCIDYSKHIKAQVQALFKE